MTGAVIIFNTRHFNGLFHIWQETTEKICHLGLTPTHLHFCYSLRAIVPTKITPRNLNKSYHMEFFYSKLNTFPCSVSPFCTLFVNSHRIKVRKRAVSRQSTERQNNFEINSVLLQKYFVGLQLMIIFIVDDSVGHCLFGP